MVYLKIVTTMSQGIKVAKKSTSSRPWFQGLVAEMNNAESKLHEDDLIVVIKDKYPKARFHYLILPKKDIGDISKVTKEDLELLKHMKTVGRKYANMHKEYEFQLGYHQVPNMNRLHLHVISTDFDSPCLKTKQHWNTFTTPYFLPIEDAIKQLEENGHVKVDRKQCKEYLQTELKCHKCLYIAKTVPDLKRHIVSHIPSQK